VAADQIGASTGGVRRWLLSNTAFQVDVPITGTAVVSSDTDVTAERLLKTGAGPAQAYRRGNILGTVSQSAGIPTGSIIQRGSNANGNFVQFADGTLICYGTVTASSADEVTLTFPFAFINASETSVQLTPQPPPGLLSLAPRIISKTTTDCLVSVVRPNDTRISSAVAFIATGRWFT